MCSSDLCAGRSAPADRGPRTAGASDTAAATADSSRALPDSVTVASSPAPATAGHAARLLASGLAALDSADHDAAVRHLEAVRRRCGARPAGRKAMLLLAAAHLDPRNPSTDPQSAADLAAAYLRTGGGEAWTGPLASVLYLEALEKGADPPDPLGTDAHPRPGPGGTAPALEDCRHPEVGATASAVTTLPTLPGPPVAQRLEVLQRRVADLQEELERIRKVLEP